MRGTRFQHVELRGCDASVGGQYISIDDQGYVSPSGGGDLAPYAIECMMASARFALVTLPQTSPDPPQAPVEASPSPTPGPMTPEAFNVLCEDDFPEARTYARPLGVRARASHNLKVRYRAWYLMEQEKLSE